MLKTVEQLKEQAKKNDITRWRVHDCSMCGYPCSFIIDGEKVSYASGCECVSYYHVQKRSWDELTNTYNMNQPENNPKIKQEYLDELNETWQFELPEKVKV